MTRAAPRLTSASSGGFTLVELLTALTVSAFVVATLVASAGHFLEAWHRSVNALSMRRQADQILETIARDLEAACIRRDDAVWFAATLQQSPQSGQGESGVVDAEWEGRVKPAVADPQSPGSSQVLHPLSGDPLDTRFGQAGLWLRFFTTQPDRNDSLPNRSAPRAVSYQIVRRRITAGASSAGGAGAPARYVLYRSSARPFGPAWPETNSTFASGYDLFRTGVTPGYNAGDASRLDHVGNVRTPRRYEQILGQDVIDFGVRIWIPDEWGRLQVAFPARGESGREYRGFAATLRDGRWRGPAATPPGAESMGGPDSELAYGYPAQVEVYLRLLSPEGARVMEGYEQGRLRPPLGQGEAEGWWAHALRHSTVFSRTVSIHGRGLP